MSFSDGAFTLFSTTAFKAALFDLDGVILDTEGQYTAFWQEIADTYFNDRPQFAHEIKGRTMHEISNIFFRGKEDVLEVVKSKLIAHQEQMTYEYIPGAPAFISLLHSHHVPMAIVTSSSLSKMQCVYKACPELRQQFDAILTAEQFTRSKPEPDCYLLAAKTLGVAPADCLVLEDSLTGLTSGRRAGMHVLGLSTTLPREEVCNLADWTIRNFMEIL